MRLVFVGCRGARIRRCSGQDLGTEGEQLSAWALQGPQGHPPPPEKLGTDPKWAKLQLTQLAKTTVNKLLESCQINCSAVTSPSLILTFLVCTMVELEFKPRPTSSRPELLIPTYAHVIKPSCNSLDQIQPSTLLCSWIF